MTNFIKKNIIDRFKNINIFGSVNSHDVDALNDLDRNGDKGNSSSGSNKGDSDKGDSDTGNSDKGDSDKGDSDKGGSNKGCSYNDELYDSLVVNMKAIGLIYKYLLKIIILNPQYRKLCKCCITNTEKSILGDNNYNYNIKAETIIDNTLKINFLINKFLDIVGKYKCSCNYKKSNFYTHKFYNYYKICKLYNDTIPLLITQDLNIPQKGITKDTTIPINKDTTITINKDTTINNEIIKNTGCIHNDIIKYKNYSYCRRITYDVDISKNAELLMKIVNINDWLVNSNKKVISLFNKQSYDYLCLNVDDCNRIEHIINKVYNIEFKSIDIDGKLVGAILVNKNLNYEFKKRFIELITAKTLEKYVLDTVVLKLCDYVLEILNYKYYEFGLYVLNNIASLYNKNTFNIIGDILNIVINSVDISIPLQVNYIKTIYKLYDLSPPNLSKGDIINKLVSISRGDIITSHFKNSYNFLVHCSDYNDRKYIIKIVKRCIIYKKHVLLDYVLSLIHNNNNKINININYFQHYFQVVYNECKGDCVCDYNYSLLLDIICKKNKGSINKAYNDSTISTSTSTCTKDRDIGYLEFCIKNNYIYSAKVLIKNNIKLESSLLWCIDNNNYIIASYILTKINNVNMVDTIIYLFDKITDETILLKFIDKITYYMINKSKVVNDVLVNKVIDSKIIQYYNKVVFINKVKHMINPFEQKEPLILYTITNNDGQGMYEITYLLLMQLFIDNKIMMNSVPYITKDMKEIISNNNINNYSYHDKNISFNVIPIILQYIKQKYAYIDYTKFTGFNIYNNENSMYNVITIITYFSIFLIYNMFKNKWGIIKGIMGTKKGDINEQKSNDVKKSNDVNMDINEKCNGVKIDINEKSNDVKRSNDVKKSINVKGDTGTMYLEIDDYDTNKVLLETEIETEIENKPKIKKDYKSKTKAVKSIDSKTILFTEKTLISSDIEDNEIYTFS